MSMFRTMARLELINLFGINEIRHSKNPGEKKRRTFLIFTILVLSAMLLGYSAAGAYALAGMELTDKIPMLYFLFAFLLQLALGVMKSKSFLYREKDLDMLSTLPVRGVHVIGARILRMYVEGVLVTLGLFTPAMIIYGVKSGAGAGLYLSILPEVLVLSVLPTAISAWVGIAVAFVISKCRHKVLAEVLLSLFLVIGLYLLFSVISSKDTGATSGDDKSGSVSVSQGVDGTTTEVKSITELSDEEMKARMKESMTNAMEKVESAFPPGRIMGEVLGEPDLAGLLIYAGLSLAVLGLTVPVIGGLFFRLSRRMVVVTRHREYRPEALKDQSVMTSLVKKEAARYFSTGIYVANTIMGPALAVAFSIATAFFDPEKLISSAGKEGLLVDLHFAFAIPYLIGMFFVMMSISSSSLSMEGKNWWFPKSLPLSAREVLGAKLLFNLIVLAPFYAVSELILLFTLKVSLLERLWLLIIPLVACVFSVLFGLTMNLKFPKFRWESATEVVKQSAASGLSLLGGAALILPGIGAMILPELYRNLLNLAVTILLGLACWRMYRKICSVRLEELGD